MSGLVTCGAPYTFLGEVGEGRADCARALWWGRSYSFATAAEDEAAASVPYWSALHAGADYDSRPGGRAFTLTWWCIFLVRRNEPAERRRPEPTMADRLVSCGVCVSGTTSTLAPCVHILVCRTGDSELYFNAQIFPGTRCGADVSRWPRSTYISMVDNVMVG